MKDNHQEQQGEIRCTTESTKSALRNNRKISKRNICKCSSFWLVQFRSLQEQTQKLWHRWGTNLGDWEDTEMWNNLQKKSKLFCLGCYLLQTCWFRSKANLAKIRLILFRLCCSLGWMDCFPGHWKEAVTTTGIYLESSSKSHIRNHLQNTWIVGFYLERAAETQSWHRHSGL